MTDYLETINNTIPEFKNEVLGIQTSIQSLIVANKIVKPFYIPFDTDNKKPFVSFIREWDVNNYLDYYSAINEMLFSFCAISPKVFIFAIHPQSNPFFNANEKFDFAKENNLIVFVISDQMALAVEMNYTIDSNTNTLVWSDDFTCTSIEDIEDPIIESFYTYSHIEDSPFTYKEILHFLSHNNTHLMIVDEDSKANKFYSVKKGPYSPSLMV